MSQRKTKAVILCFLICLLTSCAKIPRVKDETGCAKAENGNRSKQLPAADVETEKDLSAYEFLEQVKGGYFCKITMETEENILSVNAPVELTGIDPVSVLTVKVLDEKLDEEKIKDSLFKGTNVEVCDAETMVSEETATVDEDENNQVVIEEHMLSDSVNDMTLRAMEDEGGEFQRFAASIQYIGEEYRQIKTLDKKWGEEDANIRKKGEDSSQRIYLEKDIQKDFTEDMAWDSFCDAMENVGITDLKKTCGYAYCGSDGDGYYVFEFTRCMEGIPLMSGELQAQRNPLCVTGVVEVTSDGVADIQADNILWETISSQPVQCINVGQFIELVKQYQQEGKIKGNGTITFNHVELTYMMVTEDWETAEFRPVWRMYIPYQEISAKNDAHGTVEFVVDAITGEVISQISQ